MPLIKKIDSSGKTVLPLKGNEKYRISDKVIDIRNPKNSWEKKSEILRRI